MKLRLSSNYREGKGLPPAFFEVDLQLDGLGVRLVPSVEEIQAAALRCSRVGADRMKFCFYNYAILLYTCSDAEIVRSPRVALKFGRHRANFRRNRRPSFTAPVQAWPKWGRLGPNSAPECRPASLELQPNLFDFHQSSAGAGSSSSTSAKLGAMSAKKGPPWAAG